MEQNVKAVALCMQDHAESVRGEKFGMLKQLLVHSCADVLVIDNGLTCSQMQKCALLLILNTRYHVVAYSLFGAQYQWLILQHSLLVPGSCNLHFCSAGT